MSDSSSTVSVGGHSIFVREFGAEGLPPIVLVHGLYGDSSTVAPLAERFADRFHVIAPDALGHGHSDHPVDFTLEDQGRVLDGLVAEKGYDSAALVGISLGSYISAKAAILEPERVSHLVLVVSKAHGATSSSAAYAERMGFDLANASPAETLEFMAGALWSPATSPELRAEITAWQSALDIELTPDERNAIERSVRGFDLRPELDRITAPTLVISGRDDGLNPPEAGEEVARHIPGARFEVYENAGHVLAFEQIDRLVADVTEFVFGS